MLPTLTAVTQTFLRVRRRRDGGVEAVAAGIVGGGIVAKPCVATGGSARFATTVRLSTPSTLMCTVSAVAGWSASVAGR